MTRTRRIAAAAILLIALPAQLLAHAVVTPAASAPGAYQRYVLQVPNERETPTTRVEITFPTGLRVVSFAEVPGWTLELQRDEQGAVVGAAWTGVLPPLRFVELPFVAVNPEGVERLSWPIRQMYGDVAVDWTGPAGSQTPASTTSLATADEAAGGGLGTWLGGAALLLSLLALGFALRRPEGPRPTDR